MNMNLAGVGASGEGGAWEGRGPEEGADSSGEARAPRSALWSQDHHEAGVAQWEPAACFTGDPHTSHHSMKRQTLQLSP